MSKIKMIENFSKEEEITNAILHGIGFGIAAAALVLLIVFANISGTVWHIVGFSIYGSMLCLMYLSSTLFHAFPKGGHKNFFEICDHASIYLLIAGTYTPVTFTIIRGGLGWTVFGIVWGLAVAGVIFKVFWVKKFVFISTMIYVAMGWLIVMGVVPIVKGMPTISLIFLISGGILYTVGTIFYMFRWFKYHHALWHILVLFASLCHFFTMLFLVAE
jgi:hemolysin III